jgi:ATP-dependent Zn protease
VTKSSKGFVKDAKALLSWGEADRESCVPQYQTGSMTYSSLMDNVVILENFVEFSIGTESCYLTNLSYNDRLYCNGPLRPGTHYTLTLRVFTSSGWSDTHQMRFETKRQIEANQVPKKISNRTVLISVLIVFLLFALVAGILYAFHWRTSTSKYDALFRISIFLTQQLSSSTEIL